MLPVMISKRTDFAKWLGPTNAILSPLFTRRLRLSRTFCPSMVFVIPLISSIFFPHSRLGLNATYGKRLLDGWISSMVSLSMSFFLLVAWRAFATLLEKRRMNSLSSAIFSSLLFFSFPIKQALQMCRLHDMLLFYFLKFLP